MLNSIISKKQNVVAEKNFLCSLNVLFYILDSHVTLFYVNRFQFTTRRLSTTFIANIKHHSHDDSQSVTSEQKKTVSDSEKKCKGVCKATEIK